MKYLIIIIAFLIISCDNSTQTESEPDRIPEIEQYIYDEFTVYWKDKFNKPIPDIKNFNPGPMIDAIKLGNYQRYCFDCFSHYEYAETDDIDYAKQLFTRFWSRPEPDSLDNNYPFVSILVYSYQDTFYLSYSEYE